MLTEYTDEQVNGVLTKSCRILHDVLKKVPSSHPYSDWAGATRGNFLWLLELAKALSEEYTFRNSKKHECDVILDWIDTQPLFFVDYERTELPRAGKKH